MGHIRIALWVIGSSGSAGVTHFQPCYEDYLSQGQLLPRDADKITLDRFVCGNRSKTGLLCGECIEGYYSVALNLLTFASHRCKDPHLGVL